jgi:hypothetical protein
MKFTFYEIDTDPDAYRYFLFDDADPEGMYAFDGAPKGRTWRPPSAYVYKPRLPEADFSDFGMNSPALAIRPEALDRTNVAYYLGQAGELLPLPYEGRDFVVANITECIDALDHDASEWTHYDDGERFRVGTPRFRLDRLGRQIFKVPETALMSMYCYEDSNNADEQFKRYVEHEGLTGLVFRELYSVEA